MSPINTKFIAPNFTLEELLQLPANHGEEPSETVIENIKWGITHVLQPLRTKLGIPILVRVGWRGKTRNKLAGSVSSEHPNGQAVDIDIPPMSNEAIMKFCHEMDLPFYQIIDEQLYNADGSLSKWIHISWRQLGANQKPSQILKTARNSREDRKVKISRI